jgi:hypothetical protein
MVRLRHNLRIVWFVINCATLCLKLVARIKEVWSVWFVTNYAHFV